MLVGRLGRILKKGGDYFNSCGIGLKKMNCRWDRKVNFSDWVWWRGGWRYFSGRIWRGDLWLDFVGRGGSGSWGKEVDAGAVLVLLDGEDDGDHGE